jgi:hypothetical protein
MGTSYDCRLQMAAHSVTLRSDAQRELPHTV